MSILSEQTQRIQDSAGAPFRPSPISPRDYQLEALSSIQSAAARGIRRQLIDLPTGCGKTIIFAYLIRQNSERSLVLVHRDELIRQAIEKIRLVAPGIEIGIVKAERDEHGARVVVASIQTLARANRLQRVRPDFKLVVVDEAHHATADSYRRVLKYLRCFEESGPLLLGFTATPSPGDVFNEIIFERNILEMIQDGYLADLRAVQVALDCDFTRLHVRAGDFMPNETGELLSAADAPKHVVQAFHEHARDRKALIFTPSVELAHDMARAFVEAEVPAEALDACTPIEERRSILRRLRDGETKVIANCGVLTEGFDSPSVDCIVVARPTRSRTLFVQMIGRGTRVFPEKDDCLILDVVGATTRHDLLTTASFFGFQPNELAQKTVTKAVARREAREREEQLRLTEDGRLIAKTIDLFRRQKLHWVHVGERSFSLSLGDGFVLLEPDADETWSATIHRRGGRRKLLGKGLPLEYAQGVAEDFARNAGAPVLFNPKASWRRKPATQSQLRTLHSFGLEASPSLTRGEISDLIGAEIARQRSA